MVNVTVLSEDGHSVKQANEITYLVMSTWEDARKVSVDFKGDLEGNEGPNLGSFFFLITGFPLLFNDNCFNME